MHIFIAIPEMHPVRTGSDENVCAHAVNFLSHPQSLVRALRRHISRNNLAMLALLVFSLGCGFDHLTTVYGISLPNITESNPVVLHLMELGVWSETETLVILLGMLFGITIGRAEENKFKDLSMTVLATVGCTRFLAAFNNLALIIKAIY